MRAVHNRLVCLLLAVFILLAYIPGIVVRAEEYPNTYKNTGNQRQDLIGVALTQVGYKEGSNNYTKYGVWYGSANMAWCGAFVSWCANQAGIPTSVIKKNGFASASHFGLTSFTINERVPQGGDLFFRGTAHVGIVYYVEGDYFWTLEGNTGSNSDGVYCQRRSLYDSRFTFASPNYQTDSASSSGHNYVKGTETAHPHKEYYKCTDCGNMYYTGSKATVSGCKECQQENCSHSYGNYTKNDSSTHTASCSKCGKQSKLNHNWKDDQVLEEVTCENPGIKIQKCQQCGATKEITIPQTNSHKYSKWVRLDENKHVRECEVCGRQQEEEHKKSKLHSDIFEHWYECEICGDRGGNEVHQFERDCESACTVCNYQSTVGHQYSNSWLRDQSYHWLACLNCSATKDKAEHEYSDECDTTCDICGFVRQVAHEFGEEWESNRTGHWHACKLCGYVEEAQSHILNMAATENSAQLCKVCGFEVVPAKAHVHTFVYESDGTSHWGKCQCGAETGKESHLWDMRSNACEICKNQIPKIRDDSYLWFILLGAVGLVVLLIIVAVIVAAVKRKMMRAAARAAFRAMEQEDTSSPAENTPQVSDTAGEETQGFPSVNET